MSAARVSPWDVAALACVLVAAGSSMIWTRLYFSINSASFLLLLLLTLLGVLVLPVWLTARLAPAGVAARLLRSQAVAAGVVWLGVLATGGNVARSPLLVLAVLAVASGLAAWWLLGTRAVYWWPRLRAALVAGGLSYFLSAPVLATVFARDLSLFEPAPAGQRVPTLWLLLDETSFGAAPLLTAPLRGMGLQVAVHPLQAAGKNTLDVVPTFISRHVMGPSTAPCGLSSVCAEGASVDFSRVAMGREGVDLVGFYHPYCAMRGWRSCVGEVPRSATWKGQFTDLLCGLMRRGGAAEDTCREHGVVRYLATREAGLKALAAAPFWHEGGDLYAHLLLPHPPVGLQVQPSLEAAYEHNLAQASDLLVRLAGQLQRRFPANFRLVVFSDHPLRPMPQCGRAYSHRCDIPARYASPPGAVPLIVVTPGPVVVAPPASNLGILDLALR